MASSDPVIIAFCRFTYFACVSFNAALLPGHFWPRWTETSGAADGGGDGLQRVGGVHPAGQVSPRLTGEHHDGRLFSSAARKYNVEVLF